MLKVMNGLTKTVHKEPMIPDSITEMIVLCSDEHMRDQVLTELLPIPLEKGKINTSVNMFRPRIVLRLRSELTALCRDE